MGLASIVVARMLGPEGQGIVASLLAVVAIAQQFGHLGVYASIIRFVGADKSLYEKACGNSLMLGTVLGGILTVILIGLAVAYPPLYGDIGLTYITVYALAVPFSLIITMFQGVMLSLNRITPYNLLIMLRAFMVFAGAILILKYMGLGIMALVAFLVFVEAFSALLHVASSYVNRKFGLCFDFKFIKRMMGYGLKVYVATSLTILVFKFDIVLVNYFLGQAQAGIYSVSAKIAELLYMAPATIALIFFPAATRMGDRSRPFAKKVLLGVGILMLFTSIVSYVLAEPLVKGLFGEAYAGSTLPFIILIPGIFFISLETILMNYYAAKDMPFFAIATPFIGLFSNIILNIIFIPRYGISAAAATSTISYTLMFLLFLAYFIRGEKRA